MKMPVSYRNLFSMGTRMDIVLPEQGEELTDEVYQRIKAETQRLENLLSIYHHDSVFSKINREAYSHELELDQEIFQLINSMQKYSKLTSGYFDITLGAFKNPLKFKKEISADNVPSIEKVLLDPEKQSIRFLTDSVVLDSGAFGKGLALDNVKKILENYRISSAFISFGESSVLCLGHHPYGDHWKIGIQDMFKEGKNAYVFHIRDGSVSTSGNSPQNVEKYKSGHLFNPKTGKKLDGLVQMCVSTNSALEAEILSTALILANEEEYKDILSNFEEVNTVKIIYSERGSDPEVKKIFIEE